METKVIGHSSEVSRSEEFYEDNWGAKVLDTDLLDKKTLLFVNCPIHTNHQMALIKISNSGYAENVIYQCHYSDEKETCLLIVTLHRPYAPGAKSYLKPGDILGHEQLPKALDAIAEGGKEVVVPESTVTDWMPKEIPTNPWKQRGRMGKVIWDKFWESAMVDGEVNIAVLVGLANVQHPSKEKEIEKVTTGSDPLATWMTNRSGFVVIRDDEKWKVVGRGVGKTDLAPYSDPAYRKRYGFE